MLRSQDYHAHISEVHRTPSVLTDVPRYPNAHLAFNKKVVYEDNEGSHHTGESERVEEIEYDQTTIPENGVDELGYQENVDAETDQYYPKKNRGRFQLQKWKTFRP